MQPAFGPRHIAELVPTFFTSARKVRRLVSLLDVECLKLKQLRDKWEAIASEDYGKSAEGKKGEVAFDVSKDLSKVTLDIIGEAGFGSRFNAIDNGENPLVKSFQSMFGSLKPGFVGSVVLCPCHLY